VCEGVGSGEEYFGASGNTAQERWKVDGEMERNGRTPVLPFDFGAARLHPPPEVRKHGRSFVSITHRPRGSFKNTN